ncbi:Protein kinase domain protein [uncultured archaeon]|nr:Protein kinase domain protein [uncultured archaeon]
MNKRSVKPSDWPADAKHWLKEMAGKRSGTSTISIPARSVDTVNFATPATCGAVELDKLRDIFNGADTKSFDEIISSAATLTDEINHTPSREAYFLSRAESENAEIDGYRVIRLLGVGGNNAVFKVIKDDRPYILKVPFYAGEYFKEKIRAEYGLLLGVHGEISDRLNSGELVRSPNIIRMHDFKDGELTYIVLELLEKELETDRKSKGAKKGRLTDQVVEQMQGNPVQVAMFLWDVLHALEFMHDLNIVHRDVKPQNCMLTHRGSRIAAVLYDFSEGLYLGDEETVRNATPSMTPIYTAKSFIKTIYTDHINKKKNFFKDATLPRIAAVLKSADYASTAFATAHLLTGIPPYSYSAWQTKTENGRRRSVQVAKNKIDEVAPAPPHTEVCAADYATAIWNFQGDPLQLDKIRHVDMGQMFIKTIDLLLDPTTASTGLEPVYELLQQGVNQQGLFTPYTAKDAERLKSEYRR